jgi:hypothetical protein
MSLALVTLLALAAAGAAPEPTAPTQPPSTSEAASDQDLARVVSDYVGLYRHETLAQWRALFLPGFVAGSLRPDGTILQRTLDEFYEAQRSYLASGRRIRETLENVRSERRGPLASVGADFVLEDEGERSRGRLVLTLVQSEGRFRIHSLLFAYDR